MNRERLLSVLKAVQLLINGLAAVIGVIILSLSANIIAFAHEHSEEYISVVNHLNDNSYYDEISYLQSSFTLTRPILLVISGLVSVLVNTSLIIWRRHLSADSESRKVHLIVLSTTAFTLLFTLAATIYCWSEILDGKHIKDVLWGGLPGYEATIENHDVYFDPISWNCAVYPYVFVNPQVQAPGKATLRGQCYQGSAALDLLLILPLLEAAALSLYVWLRHDARKAEGRKLQELRDGEPDAYRMDDLQGLVRSDRHRIQN